MDFATVVLRELPESHSNIHLDLQTIPAEESFRGFSLLPPGLHVIRAEERILWAWLQPGEIAIYNLSEHGFEPENGLRKATNVRLLRSGAFRGTLVPYNFVEHDTWYALTNALKPGTPSQPPNPFDPSLTITHADEFLAGLQMSFIKWITSEPEDKMAFRHWVAHLGVVYQAEPDLMASSPWLFGRIGTTLIAQFGQLNDAMLINSHPIAQGAQRFALRLIQTNIADLIDKGSRLRIYLAQRQTRVS